MLADVEIIESPKELIYRAYDISISVKEKLLVTFPRVNSFRRNVRLGMPPYTIQRLYDVISAAILISYVKENRLIIRRNIHRLRLCLKKSIVTW